MKSSLRMLISLVNLSQKICSSTCPPRCSISIDIKLPCVNGVGIKTFKILLHMKHVGLELVRVRRSYRVKDMWQMFLGASFETKLE